jgi:hypothetical protein
VSADILKCIYSFLAVRTRSSPVRALEIFSDRTRPYSSESDMRLGWGWLSQAAFRKLVRNRQNHSDRIRITQKSSQIIQSRSEWFLGGNRPQRLLAFLAVRRRSSA